MSYYNQEETLFLDIETDFKGIYSQPMQVAVLDGTGKTRLNSTLKCKNYDQEGPSWNQTRDELARLLTGKHVIVYNLKFDAFFFQEILSAGRLDCCMIAFARWNNETYEPDGSYLWKKLVDACQIVGYKHPRPHDPIEDCRATRAIWQFLQEKKGRKKSRRPQVINVDPDYLPF